MLRGRRTAIARGTSVRRGRRVKFFMKIVQKMMLGALSISAALGTTALAADLSEWAEGGFLAASEAGLVSYSVVSNNLKDSITREEFCELAMKLYTRLTNEELPVPSNTPFEDTDSMAVVQAYNYGIVNGTDDTHFSPNKLVTRQEMAKMLVSTLNASEVSLNVVDGADSAYVNAFTDGGDVSSWAMSSVNTLLSYELMTGVTDYTLEPLAATSREQAIVSVERSYSKFGDTLFADSAPVITLPESEAYVETKSFDINWESPADAVSYHVIVKNADGKAVVLKDVSAQSITLTNSSLSNGEYSVTIGAVFADGTEAYSLPVDFVYHYEGNRTILSVDLESGAASNNPTIRSILALADSLKGIPYRWGGTTTAGFDCSGFVQYVYKQNGYNITRTTYTQWDNDGVFVSRQNLQPGDLVYFGTGSKPSHVGMYVGNGMMIHSPRTGDVIKYSTIDSGYYQSRFLGGKRIIK